VGGAGGDGRADVQTSRKALVAGVKQRQHVLIVLGFIAVLL